MKKEKITSFHEFLEKIESVEKEDNTIILYRGQSDQNKLLPSIARTAPAKDTTKLEMEMLEDLKRRSRNLIKTTFTNDWEWLVFAQHYGLKTRLLDWSSNPLVALWFACSNEYKLHKNSYVYILAADDTMLVDT